MSHEYNFEHILLPSKHIKFLKKVSKKNIIIEDYEPLLGLKMIYYHEEKMIDGVLVPTSKLFHITEKGLCYLQYRKEQNRPIIHNWINSIAVAATAIIALIALFKNN